MAPITSSGSNVTDSYSVGVLKMALKNQVNMVAQLYQPLASASQNVNSASRSGAASKDPPHVGNNVNITA